MKTNEIIKKLRKKKGINQTELGKKTEMSLRSISSIERGETDPSTNQLKEFSKFFNVSIDHLVFGKKEEKIEKTEMEFLKIIRSDNEIKKALETIINAKKKIINFEIMAA